MPTTMPLFDIDQQITSSKDTGTTMDSGMKSVGTAATLLKEDSDDAFLFMDIDDTETDSDSDDDNSDDESEDDSDDDEDYDSDEEVEAAEQMLKELKTMRRARTFGSMGDLRGKGEAEVKNVFAERSAKRVQNTSMPKTFSAADLQQLMTHFNPEQETRKQKELARRESSVFEKKTIGHIGQATSAQQMTVNDDAVNPDKHLAKLLGGNPTFFSHDDDALEGFFLPNTAAFKEAWIQELTRAVRDQDMPTLEEMHRTGQNLQACNAFGESIIHLAVRRGSPEALRFLLQDAGISMRVRCDLGRSPVHDAAWCLASNPKSYQMMALLLNESPMQLLIKDKRGYTPLQYVPRAKWSECNDFLDRQCKKGRFASLMMNK